MNNEIIVSENKHWLSPVAEINHAVARYQQMKDFVSRVLRVDVDYGKIPGTSKDTLLKPGAEKLAAFFGLRHTFEDVVGIEDWTGEAHAGEPFFYYRQKCNLYRGDELVGNADGSCNSWEKKYRYRTEGRACPVCGNATIKRSKFAPRNNPQAKPGWYCYDKLGGCGSNFDFEDERLQTGGQVKNPNPADITNTILKMAQKRAFVAAVLLAVNGSEYFTQDVEDLGYEGPEVIQGAVVVTTPEPAVEGEVVEDAQASSNNGNENVTDWRLKLATVTSPSVATVASMVLNSCDYYKHENHVVNASERDANDRLTTDEALELYDALIGRTEATES